MQTFQHVVIDNLPISNIANKAIKPFPSKVIGIWTSNLFCRISIFVYSQKCFILLNGLNNNTDFCKAFYKIYQQFSVRDISTVSWKYYEYLFIDYWLSHRGVVWNWRAGAGHFRKKNNYEEKTEYRKTGHVKIVWRLFETGKSRTLSVFYRRWENANKQYVTSPNFIVAVQWALSDVDSFYV